MATHPFWLMKAWRSGLGLLLMVLAAGTLPLAARAQAVNEPSPSPEASLCPEAALNRFTQYSVQAGDTLASIAQAHNLLPATLVGLNPSLQNNQALRSGLSLSIPPFNGIRATVPAGQTWQQVGETYKTRADVLFEINGCQAEVPAEIFVPGIHWFPNVQQALNPASAGDDGNQSVLAGYPLPAPTKVVMNYGWQPHPTEDKLVFNTGIALETAPATPVLAVGAGVVAFSGRDQVYGNLVVVNHADGLQTRYANLSGIAVQPGERVNQGDVLGDVGPAGDPDDASFLFFEVRLNSTSGWVAQDPQDYMPTLALY